MKRIANYLILFPLILQGAGLVFATTAASDEEIAKKFGINTEAIRQIRQFEGLTNESLQRVPIERIPSLVWRLQHPDLPRQRAEFRLLQEENEQGEIPPNGLRDALQELRQFRKGLLKSTVAGLPVGTNVNPARLMPPQGELNRGNWTSLGPSKVGGRTRSIVLHPTDPSRFWLGSVGGGIWQTIDGGKHFLPVDDFMASLAVACMVIDPTDPNVIYAGTGEGVFYYGGVPRGAGIFQTADGTHWSRNKAKVTADFPYVNRLAISADGKVLLAATSQPDSNGGIFRNDRTADPERLQWKRTCEGQFVDIECHPTDSNKAVASTADGAVYYSEDAGKEGSWHPASHVDPWSSRVELAYCRRNPDIVYASVTTNGGEIWRSGDGGKTFVRRASQSGPGELAHYLGDQGNYANCIWAGDPTNEDFVVVGGINLFRSTDGGDNLIDISNDVPGSAHADNHAIVASRGFDGVANKTVFFGNDGGVYKTDDVYTVGSDPERVTGWVNLNNDYVVTQFYGAAGNDSGVIVGGTQDNDTMLYAPQGGTEKWKVISGGDGGFCAADPHDAKVFYGEYIFGSVHRTTDGGATDSQFISGIFWDGKTLCWKPIPYTITDTQYERALFIAPIVLDPNDSSRLLVGCSSLWRTNDARAQTDDSTGPTWKVIKKPSGSPISAIAMAPGDPDVIWVGDKEGSIFKTTDGLKDSPHWKELTASSPRPPRRYCTRLTIDPRDHKVVFATFGGFSRGNIWKTDNGGSSWIPINDALPDHPPPVRDLAIHPARSDYLYLATEIGVFGSQDAGKTWSPTNEGPTNCPVDQLFWMEKTLVAVTHGRGIFTIDLSKVH